MSDESKTTSEPPPYKALRAKLDAVIDWWVCTCLTALWLAGKLNETERLVALVGMLTIAGVSQVLKRLGIGGSVTGLALGFAATVAKTAVVMLMHPRVLGSLVLAALLSGCGATLSDASKARPALKAIAAGMARIGPAIAAACAPDPEPAWCVDLREGYETVRVAHGLAQTAIDLAEMAQ